MIVAEGDGNLKFQVRQGQPSDLWAVNWLRSLVGWNQAHGLWRTFLTEPSARVFVACSGALVIGSSMVWNYQGRLAWIGMVMVHPAYRRRGIAKSLLDRCLSYASERDVDIVGLDATPAGLPLYRSLGFVSGDSLGRWVLESFELRKGRKNIQKHGFTERTLEGLTRCLGKEFDRHSFGVERGELLASLLPECRASVAIGAECSEGLGYGLLRHGARQSYLGPVVAETETGGRLILDQLLAEIGDEGVIWDIPKRNRSAEKLALDRGFRMQRTLTRMWRPTPLMADRPERVWAIVDPALG